MGFPQKDTSSSRKIPTLVNHLPNVVPSNSDFNLPTPVSAHIINHQNHQVPAQFLNPKPITLQHYSFPPIVQPLQPLIPNLQLSHHLPPPPNITPHYTIPPPLNLQHPSLHLPPNPANIPTPVAPLPTSFTFHVGNINYKVPPAPAPSQSTQVSSSSIQVSQVPVDLQRKPKKAAAIAEGIFPNGKTANIQGFLDKCRDNSFIGLEYVIEIQSTSDKKSFPSYSCRLCEVMYRTKDGVSTIDNMRQHLATQNHKYKYLAKHFPGVLKEWSVNSFADDKINEIVEKVEAKYGRLKVKLICGTKMYKKNLPEIDQVIQQSEHFDESREFLDELNGKKLMTTLTNMKDMNCEARSTSRSTTEEVGGSYSKERTSQLRDRNPSPDRRKKRQKRWSRSPVRNPSPGRTKKREKSWSRSPVRNKSSSTDRGKKRENWSRSPSTDRRKKREKSWSRSPSPSLSRRKRNSSIKAPIEVCLDSSPEERKSRTPDSRKINRSRSRSPDSRRRNRSRSRSPSSGRRNRSRSRSPGSGRRNRSRSRSPGSGRRNRSRSRSPGGYGCKIPEEPRREFNRLKREERVRQFIEEERKMRIKLRGRREEHEKEFKDNNYNYSRHQKYSSEYIEFSEGKFGNRWRPKLSELDLVTKKQWRQHWLNILQEEHRESKETMTEELMRKHQIIQRDLDDYIEQKDNASKNRTRRDTRITPDRKARKTSPRNRKPRSVSPSPIKVTKYDVTVLGTLRLISAWENYLDEIGPKANVYLNKALFMESKKQDSSEDLVNEVDFCKMLDASLEKLKYRMGTGVIGESQEKTNCRICINNIALLLQRSTCEKQEILEIGVSKINSSSKETDHEIKKAITQQVFKQHSQQLGERELNLIVEKVYEKLKNPNPAPNDILESLSCGVPPQQAPSLASGHLFSSYSGQQEASQLQPQRPSSNNLQEVDWVNISKIVTQINTGPSQTQKPRHNSGPFQQQNENLELSQPRMGLTDQVQPINVRTVEQVNKGVGDCNNSAQNTDKSEHDEDDEIQIIEPVKVEQIDPYDELDTDDLVDLLKNFKELERSQQECLLAYMKKLEKNQPDKARRLNFKFRYDPEQDEIYKQVVEVEKKCVEMEKRLAGLEDEVEGITRGHLNKASHAEALKTLEKKCKETIEELMRMLEVLDSISLTEDQQECRVKRKSVIGRINKALDHDDRLVLKVSDLIKNGVP